MKKQRNTSLIIGPDYLDFIEELKARVVSARVTAARAITREAFLPESSQRQGTLLRPPTLHRHHPLQLLPINK